MSKENYEAPTAVELGDFDDETGLIGHLSYETLIQSFWGW